MQITLADFHILRPRFELSQEQTLQWIAKAHTKAEAKRQNTTENAPLVETFAEELRTRLYKLGLGKEKIQKRGLEFVDFSHFNWKTMEIFSLEHSLDGESLTKRSVLFDQVATEKFTQFYPEKSPLPDHLIHVTCTGYVAPSGAQKIVSQRNHGKKTIVTHAYHMGCYGAMPAIRMAAGFVHSQSSCKADIVHTELCTLHMNPSLHETAQLVVQTLFADGFIKYSVQEKETLAANTPYFQLLSTYDEILPKTLDKMTWTCEDWGFRMTISPDIPLILADSLSTFVETLLQKADLSQDHINQAIFAVHPGGPKIIAQVASLLHLQEHQIHHSKEILKNYGNMSSATLPHIWEKILHDDDVKEGTLIISLAFGPGLNISGSLLQKSRS